MDELADLIDILHEITAPDEEEPEDLFPCDDDDDTYVMDFLETAIHLMDIYIEENPTAVTEPDFEEVFKETITDLFFVQFEEMEDVEEEIEDILADAFDIYFSTFYQCRSSTEKVEDETEKEKEKEMETLAEKIQELRSLPQPTQRTKEWYHFRHNLITASNAYKAFESQATKNQLIYEKCQPIPSSTEPTQMVNVNSTFHWGQKYEPLSVMMYEHLYNTKIEDFGCIQHKTHKFLGASPDGINVDSNNTELYGRMLEIKNIVNREITGIPKKEYWIQTQLQMEVCDLDECDFLETKFVEYENSIAYYDDNHESLNSCLSRKGEHKGIVMYFSTKEGRPHYVYLPLILTNEEQITQWEEDTLDKFEGLGMTWIKNCYWKLEKLSCVLITRNKKWFLDNIGAIADIWSIIERERVSGYEHRAPTKRVKKETYSSSSSFTGCYLKITKEDY